MIRKVGAYSSILTGGSFIRCIRSGLSEAEADAIAAPKRTHSSIGLVTDASDIDSYVGTEGFIPPEGPGSGSMSADIYALGKVLYEISAGNDRHAYPELPVELGNQVEQCDFVELNKITLGACRANPRQRYPSADAMLLALLDCQFNANALLRERRIALLTKCAAVVGAVVALRS